jgi:hypothetical protein
MKWIRLTGKWIEFLEIEMLVLNALSPLGIRPGRIHSPL